MKELASGDLTQLKREEAELLAFLGSMLLPEERYDKENALLEVPILLINFCFVLLVHYLKKII